MSTTHPYAVRLGRRHAPDERDRLFRMATVAPPPTPGVTSRYWRLGAQLDQGDTPRCVGYSTRQLLQSSPHRYTQADPSADTIYRGAQENDEWPGTDYDGTSDRGAMKYLQSLSLIAAYHWAFSLDEMEAFVLTTGPVLVGSDWHTAMFTPDARGVVHPGGGVAGGHEYLLYGVNRRTGVYSFDNSWGLHWGPLMGRFKMHREEFAQVVGTLGHDGDICAPVEA